MHFPHVIFSPGGLTAAGVAKPRWQPCQAAEAEYVRLPRLVLARICGSDCTNCEMHFAMATCCVCGDLCKTAIYVGRKNDVDYVWCHECRDSACEEWTFVSNSEGSWDDELILAICTANTIPDRRCSECADGDGSAAPSANVALPRTRTSSEVEIRASGSSPT